MQIAISRYLIKNHILDQKTGSSTSIYAKNRHSNYEVRTMDDGTKFKIKFILAGLMVIVPFLLAIWQTLTTPPTMIFEVTSSPLENAVLSISLLLGFAWFARNMPHGP